MTLTDGTHSIEITKAEMEVIEEGLRLVYEREDNFRGRASRYEIIANQLFDKFGKLEY